MDKPNSIIHLLEHWEIAILISFTVLYALFEYLRPLEKRRKYRFEYLKDFVIWFVLIDHLLLPLLEGKIEPSIKLTIARFMPKNNGIFSINEMNFFIQFIIVFLILEFINYFFHRFIKHGNWFWNFHKIHHNSKYLNQFTDAKNHPVMILFEGFVFILPILYLLTPKAEVLIIFATLRTLWGPLIHANINLKWPYPISHILSSPFTHRWHHAKGRGHCNYAGVFILYDVIFKTFYSPEETCDETGFSDESKYPSSTIKALLYPIAEIKKNKGTIDD